MIRTELLNNENFNEYSLDSYERRQNVKKVYRRTDGIYKLVDLPYTEDWTLEEKREKVKMLSDSKYITYLALDGSRIVGFIGLPKTLVDGYMILDMIHVSAQYRGHGTGRKLFELGKAAARKAGAKALYISACSSEETIAFYKAMGAVLAENPIKSIAEKEPYDLQMICKIE